MTLNNSAVYSINGTAISNIKKLNLNESRIFNSYISEGSDTNYMQVVLNQSSNATLNIVGGEITSNSTASAINNILGAKIYLGTEDGNVSITSPSIYGGDYGIRTPSSEIYFYDGIVSGSTKAVDGNVTATQTGYKTYTAINSDNRQEMYLIEARFVNLQLTTTAGGTVSGGGMKEAQKTVTVVATAMDDYVFIGWYGQDGTLVSTDATYTFTMPDKSLILNAVFQEKYVYLTDATSSAYKSLILNKEYI